jgi:hypothetical protein
VNSYENVHASFIYSFGVIHDLPSLKNSMKNKLNGEIANTNQQR